MSGSLWDLTVRDGQIVSGDQHCEIAQFSPQMREPFATWVFQNYPKDAAAMYANSLTDFPPHPEVDPTLGAAHGGVRQGGEPGNREVTAAPTV